MKTATTNVTHSDAAVGGEVAADLGVVVTEAVLGVVVMGAALGVAVTGAVLEEDAAVEVAAEAVLENHLTIMIKGVSENHLMVMIEGVAGVSENRLVTMIEGVAEASENRSEMVGAEVGLIKGASIIETVLDRRSPKIRKLLLMTRCIYCKYLHM